MEREKEKFVMPKPNNSENNGKLPTNIENATRGHVTQNLAEWQASIISARAARLGVSVKDASRTDDKPLFVVEAEKRARNERRNLSSILKEYSDQIQYSQYPTADCLMPDEVEEYVKAVLPSERHEHINECNACRMLVDAAQVHVPPEESNSDIAIPVPVAIAAATSGACLMPHEVAEFIAAEALPKQRYKHVEQCAACSSLVAEALPATMEIGDLLEVSEPVAAYAAAVAVSKNKGPKNFIRAHSRFFFLAKLKKWGLVATPMILIFLGYYLYLKLQNAGTDWPTDSSGEVWLLAAFGLFLYFISLVGFRAVPHFRSIANGVIVGGIILGYVQIDARENQRIAESAFQWNGAASLGMASIQQLENTGTFLGPQHASITGHSLAGNSGSVNINVKTSPEEATYVVTATKLPGQITVDVHGDSGSLKWEDGDRTIKRADILTGWVEQANTADSAGTEQAKELVVGPQRFQCAACALLPASGTRIVATVNPTTARVENYLVISQRIPVKRH
jgi:hypothetical protein